MAQPRVLVVDDDKTLQLLLRLELQTEGFEVLTASDGEEALRLVAEATPDCLVLDLMMPGLSGLDVLRELRSSPRTASTSVILLTGQTHIASETEAFALGADHYMTKPFEVTTLVARIRSVVTRSGNTQGLSPLTGLPGNVKIESELETRLRDGRPMALIHADIDHFKAFNDRYGFLQGDKIIQFCADVLGKAAGAMSSESAFIGHVGGDDFVIILDADDVDQFCKTALDLYDVGVADFYDAGDVIAGGIEVEDRQGQVRKFPISTLSMGVATNAHRELHGPAEASTIAAEMKHFAKRHEGSNYQVDKRIT